MTYFANTDKMDEKKLEENLEQYGRELKRLFEALCKELRKLNKK